MISEMTGCQVISSLPPPRVLGWNCRGRGVGDLLHNVLLLLMLTSSPHGSVISAPRLLLQLGSVTSSGTLMSPPGSFLEQATYFDFFLILILG